MKPKNHGLPWSQSDDQKLRLMANVLVTKKDMYLFASAIAREFERTEVSVCKRIEMYKNWFWAA